MTSVLKITLVCYHVTINLREKRRKKMGKDMQKLREITVTFRYFQLLFNPWFQPSLISDSTAILDS